jgi:hypothetical protein
VNCRVAVNKEYRKLKQMPVVQSTLTRKIFFSSATSRSKITITTDVYSVLRNVNEKLDSVTKMHENKKASVPVPRIRTARKLSSSLNWESLRLSKQTAVGPLPDTQGVYRIGEALKMFLEDEADKLEPAVKEDGELILNFVSLWESSTEELRCYGYKKLVVFMNKNAKNWKLYKFLDIPDSNSLNSENCHRRWSQIYVTDASSPFNRTSTIPRRIALKKYVTKL